jgi:F-type H+-transporting ATPase subunit epsilon
VALRATATEVVTPGIGGEFGVLPGHVPTLVALRTGVMRYEDTKGETHAVAVSHGFCEVFRERVILLTEAFKREGDVDVVRVRKRLVEVDEALDGWEGEMSDPERKKLVEEEQWLAAQLDLVGDPPAPFVREDTRFGEEIEEPIELEDEGSGSDEEDR